MDIINIVTREYFLMIHDNIGYHGYTVFHVVLSSSDFRHNVPGLDYFLFSFMFFIGIL